MIEAESAVLAGLLLDPARAQKIAEIVRPEDFSTAPNRIVYRALRSLLADSLDVDVRTVQARLESRGELESVGGLAYLAGLEVNLPDLNHLTSYARFIREAADKRRAGDALRNGLANLSKEGEDINLGHVFHDVRAMFDQIENGQRIESLSEFRRVVAASMAGVDRRREHGKVLGLPTGHADIDLWTNGFEPGQLIVVAGRPGMGKSILAQNWAQHAACRLAETVVVFTLEMSEQEWALRAQSSLARVDFTRLRAGHLSSAEVERLRLAQETHQHAPLWIDGNARRTVGQIAVQCRRLQQKADGLALIIVDYVGLVTPERRGERREVEIAETSRGLKQIAKDLGVPVVALAQLNREPDKRENHRPMLADLRESGALEQDADMVAFLYRDHYYDKKADEEDTELIIAKYRQGQTGTLHLRWLPKFMTFEGVTR